MDIYPFKLIRFWGRSLQLLKCRRDKGKKKKKNIVAELFARVRSSNVLAES